MPIKSYGFTPDPYRDPPTVPVRRVPAMTAIAQTPLSRPLDEPDPHGMTPIFDSIWHLSGLAGRHALNPDREVPTMTGRHNDRDGDGRADHWDRQSLVFRENTDHIPDAGLEDHAELVHPPIQSVDEIRLPEAWEAFDWDRDRSTPKTTSEAAAALADRIADPLAPDDHRVAGAYDGPDAA